MCSPLQYFLIVQFTNNFDCKKFEETCSDIHKIEQKSNVFNYLSKKYPYVLHPHVGKYEWCWGSKQLIDFPSPSLSLLLKEAGEKGATLS